MDYRKKGFTIIELLVVIVIIGVLASVVIVSFSNVSQRAIVSSLQTDLANAKKQLQNYQTQNGVFPTQIACPASLTTDICIKASSGVTLSYTPFNSTGTPSYYISATTGNNIYHTTDNSAITSQTTTSNEGLSFNLDAGNTSSYPGSGSTWSDLIGNLTSPQLAGGYGSTYRSITFNGVDGRLVRGVLPSSLQTFSTSNNRTWEMMVKVNNNTDLISLFGLKASAGCTYYCNGGFLSFNGSIRFTWYDNSSYQYLISGVSFGAGLFYHLIASYDFSDRKPRLYVNGVLRDTYASATNIDYGNLWSGLGYEAGYDSRTTPSAPTIAYLNGEIGYLKYYHNRALSAGEVLQNFNATRSRYGL